MRKADPQRVYPPYSESVNTMEQDKHIYRAKLDFLYQSIAMYAATIVVYLIVRSLFITKAFPSLWQDPLLLLLCAITLVSVLALGYNLYMQRRIEIRGEDLIFHSRARERRITRADVERAEFGRERGEMRRGIRIVKLRLRDRRRSVRIRLLNFEHSKRLLNDLKEWAGPLAASSNRRRGVRRSGRSVEGEGSAAL